MIFPQDRLFHQGQFSHCSILFIMNIFKGTGGKKDAGNKKEKTNNIGERNKSGLETVSDQFACLEHKL